MLVDRSESHTLALSGISAALAQLASAIGGHGGTVSPKKNALGPWTSTIDRSRAERLVRDLKSARTPLYVCSPYRYAWH
jgi:hypothetical protein